MEDNFLIYINHVGQNYTGNYIYEFLFSDSLVGVDGLEWDEFPAAGKPSPPDEAFVTMMSTLKGELKFELVQESDSFSVWDAVDGIVSLGWEDVSEYEEYPESRLFFKFGETAQSVVDKFYSRDINLVIKNVKK